MNNPVMGNPAKETPFKMKFLEGNWMVFEKNERLWAAHFCSGKKDSPQAQAGIKQAPWFHKAVDIEKSDKCAACEEEVPKHLFMAIKINNVTL